MPKLGPYSRPDRLANLDGRTKESRLLAEVRQELVAHVGGAPSATQRMAIERCAMLSLHLALMERDLLDGGVLSERNSRQYIAWSNSLSRTLRLIGMEPVKIVKQRSLADHLAAKAGASA